MKLAEGGFLQVTSPTSVLRAGSVVGALRGLESFSQMVDITAAKPSRSRTQTQNVTWTIREGDVSDWPRFPHRGLLLDTSRHFLPVPHILRHLDAMAWSKMNVLHWHITDDDSFPLRTAALPELADKGAFSPLLQYSMDDVTRVVSYATERGIRVIPEVDTPGHTLSWGRAMPQLLADCHDAAGRPTGSKGPLDPSDNATYEVVARLLAEVAAAFPDSLVHLGGDEVDLSCWQSSPTIQRWMEEHGLWSSEQALGSYVSRVLRTAAALNKSSIVWQEVFDLGAKLLPDTIVQVWKGGEQPAHAVAHIQQAGASHAQRLASLHQSRQDPEASGPIPDYLLELAAVTRHGQRVLLSAPWYLDRIARREDWVDYYRVEPLAFPGGNDPYLASLVLGGEACLWGEFVDATNSLSRAWPRAAAVAERLWSSRDVRDVDLARSRLAEHRCRMVARGIPAQPLAPGYCPSDYLEANTQ